MRTTASSSRGRNAASAAGISVAQGSTARVAGSIKGKPVCSFAERAGCGVRALDPAYRLGDEGLTDGRAVAGQQRDGVGDHPEAFTRFVLGFGDGARTAGTPGVSSSAQGV